ncbi:MAG: ribosome silencing factor [Planctomycetaceae bacterium]|nr:ribosome silencing factor [Planctomycetaceae bacterium]
MAAQAAGDLRGKEIVVLDLTAITPVVDYFVLATANSRRQMRAIGEEVNRVLREAGSRRIGLEGQDGSNWLLQDYGDIVLHVFDEESRSLYDLEHLWADATRIDLELRTGETPSIAEEAESSSDSSASEHAS